MENKISIVINEDYNNLYNILKKFDKEFSPNISEINSDIKQFTKKLYDNGITLVAYCNRKIIGFCSFYCNDKINKKAFLSLIAVRKGYRNNKVGLLLLNKCILICKKNQMKLINLEVFNDNVTAQNFYANNGFEFLENKTNKSKILQKRI